MTLVDIPPPLHTQTHTNEQTHKCSKTHKYTKMRIHVMMHRGHTHTKTFGCTSKFVPGTRNGTRGSPCNHVTIRLLRGHTGPYVKKHAARTYSVRITFPV